MTALGRLSLVCLMGLLTGCASATAGAPPPLVGLQENVAASFRVDIVDYGHGSGTVINHEGYILTAYHVAKGHHYIGLALDDGGPYPLTYIAEVVATDEKSDLAVIKIDRHFDYAATIASVEEMQVGAPIYSGGYPGHFGQMVHRGAIAELNYAPPKSSNQTYAGTMLVDFNIGPGDSGGGVFSATSGHLIGVAKGMVGREIGGPWIIYPVCIQVNKIRAFLDAHSIPYNEPQP